MENASDEKVNVRPRYVDILTNGGFKALFGYEENKHVVMSIINVLLPEHRRVVDIDYIPTEHQGPVVGENKEFQYDFTCRDEAGTVFIVELQTYKEKNWFERCVSYAARVYDRQNRRGEDYGVPPVYLIGLMDTEIDHPDKEFWADRYVSEYTFREKSCGDLLGETIVIIFAELVKFHKKREECKSDLDKMLYLLRNMGHLKEQPEDLQQEVYTRIFDACEIAAFSDEKRAIYDKDMNDEKRRRGELAAAREEGIEEGIEKGVEKGIEKGREEGLNEAVKKMLAAGLPAEQIASIMMIPIEQIEDLK